MLLPLLFPQVTDSSGHTLYSKDDAKKGKFAFTTDNYEIYEICFESHGQPGKGFPGTLDTSFPWCSFDHLPLPVQALPQSLRNMPRCQFAILIPNVSLLVGEENTLHMPKGPYCLLFRTDPGPESLYITHLPFATPWYCLQKPVLIFQGEKCCI